MISNQRPGNIQNVQAHTPSIIVELAYATEDNFTGSPVPGYKNNIAYLTTDTIHALTLVQDTLLKRKLSLYIFDAYRPHASVQYFLGPWSSLPDEMEFKQRFYPNKSKQELFEQGFLAKQSTHTRGSTVDLSLYCLTTNNLIDMGTEFDYFDERSFVSNQEISEIAQTNRRLLSSLMHENGFIGYEKEWWHFRLAKEPYPDTYFDFEII